MRQNIKLIQRFNRLTANQENRTQATVLLGVSAPLGYMRVWCYISNRFIRYPNTEKRVEKTRCSRVFFLNQFGSVCISDETLFRVFDVASQSINNS